MDQGSAGSPFLVCFPSSKMVYSFKYQCVGCRWRVRLSEELVGSGFRCCSWDDRRTRRLGGWYCCPAQFHSSFPWPRALHLDCDRPLHNNLKDARSTMLMQPNEFSMQSTMLAHPLVLCLFGPLWVFGCLDYSNYGVCDVCVFVVPCECLVVFVSNITWESQSKSEKQNGNMPETYRKSARGLQGEATLNNKQRRCLT